MRESCVDVGLCFYCRIFAPDLVAPYELGITSA